jgi:hypothetical protein
VVASFGPDYGFGELARLRNRHRASEAFGDDVVDRLERAYRETDRLADDVAECFGRLPGRSGWEMLDLSLSDGIEAVPNPPEALITLMNQLTTIPEWVDWDMLERGAVAYMRPGVLTGLALACAALAAGYRSGPGVKPLVRTGRLVDKAGFRVRETGSWLHSVCGPGQMRPGGSGFSATVRVRLVHAMVRQRLMKSSDWQWGDWGAPLNDGDTAQGIVGEFSSVMIGAVVDAGIHYTQDERDSIYHLWQYVGYILGVPADLLPVRECDALVLAEAFDLVAGAPDEDSRLLVRSLICDGLIPLLPLPEIILKVMAPHIAAMLFGITRRWAGRDVADQLGLPSTRWGLIIPLFRPVVQLRELGRRIGVGSSSALAARCRARAAQDLGRAGSPSSVIDPASIPLSPLNAVEPRSAAPPS